MTLPLSRNTTYAALSQVKSADLNDLQDKIIDLWALAVLRRPISHQIFWSPIGSSFVGARSSDNVSPLFEGDTSANTEIYTREAGVIANSPFPSLNTRIKSTAGPTERAVIYPKDDGAGNNAWWDDLDDLIISMEFLFAVSNITGGQDISIGMGAAGTFGTSPPYSVAGVHLMKSAAFGTDNLFVGAIEGSKVDTGVAGVNDTWNLIRLEYHGKNTPLGGANGTAYFHIDGTLEATITTGLPTGASQLTPYFFHRDNVAATDLDMYVGPVWIEWTSLNY